MKTFTFTTKDVYNTILLLAFLILSLFLLRYIRSKEGFANPEPQPEFYNLDLFFKDYPLQEVCPIYTSIFNQMVKSESTDEQGKPIPNDIALEKATKKVGLEVPIGIFPCPFEFPESNDLDVVVSFVEKLDKRLLSKAKNTLLFCAVSLQMNMNAAKSAISKLPKKEGFLTQCSQEELDLQNIVPLQCIPADKMKATEQSEINKDDKVIQIQKVAKKQTIAKRLAEISRDYTAFQTSYAKDINGSIDFMSKEYQKAAATADLAQRLTKDSSDEVQIRGAVEAKQDADMKKKALERLQMYKSLMNLSIKELIEKCKQLSGESTTLQKQLESGNLSF